MLYNILYNVNHAVFDLITKTASSSRFPPHLLGQYLSKPALRPPLCARLNTTPPPFVRTGPPKDPSRPPFFGPSNPPPPFDPLCVGSTPARRGYNGPREGGCPARPPPQAPPSPRPSPPPPLKGVPKIN